LAERKTYFVDVILPVPIHRAFTYRLPQEWENDVHVGSRVVVPFGKSKFQTGLVTKIHEQAPAEYTVKYVECLLDETPIVTTGQFHFWSWIAGYYMSSIGEVMNAALPTNFKIASETMVAIHPDFEPGEQDMTEQETAIFEVLVIQEKCDLKQLIERTGITSIHPIIKKMFQRRILLPFEELNDRFTPKTATYVLLNEELQDPEKLAECLYNLEQNKRQAKQLEAMLQFLALGQVENGDFQPVPKTQLVAQGVSQASMASLERNGIIHTEKLIVSRINFDKQHVREPENLSEAQHKAYDEINICFQTFNTTLLHGVTGSGKTEIYVHLIQEQIKSGKQVLFLLPEIALTTQLIQRLQEYFGELVGVYHSRFNQNERVEIWNSVLENNPHKFRIILGARSSVFLPFSDLGLIIVDEEHETSYKQHDPSPRYHARDAAIVLGIMHKAKVLLGSATPSLETYFNAKNKKYGLVELSERYGGIRLPEIFFADIKKERAQQTMHSHFSSFLMEELMKTIEEGQQAIFFQNRRGYTPLWNCEVCSWTPKCTNCDVSLTYHKHSNQLKCHYCGFVTAPIGTCAQCGSNRLRMIGFGTEKIEDELILQHPELRVKRLDLDTTRAKHAYAKLLTEFEEKKIDVLIGTQMITKGLDFEHVQLVGVLDADMLLHRPDFRAFERSYQLISQVAGRAGRKHKRGKVIIQTADPDHWVLRRVMEHDYLGFYNSEIMERKHFLYPPFYKLIDFTLKHKDEKILQQGSLNLTRLLKEVFHERVMGPEKPLISRLQQYFLMGIKLKMEKDLSDKKVKEHIRGIIDAFYSVPSHKSIRLVINVDPY
jgi:primosomal protein N' (replication factor Y)